MNIFGVFVPALMVYFVVSFCILVVLRRVLAWVGAYRLLWHRALVDMCLLVLILAAVTAFLPKVMM